MTLTREEGRGLGFTVAGGANTTGGCYIKAVLQNPALSDGRLKSGDKLIKVKMVLVAISTIDKLWTETCLVDKFTCL